MGSVYVKKKKWSKNSVLSLVGVCIICFCMMAGVKLVIKITTGDAAKSIVGLTYNNAYYESITDKQSLTRENLPKVINPEDIGSELGRVTKDMISGESDNKDSFVDMGIYAYTPVGCDSVLVVGDEKMGYTLFTFCNYLDAMVDASKNIEVLGLKSEKDITSIEIFRDEDAASYHNKTRRIKEVKDIYKKGEFYNVVKELKDAGDVMYQEDAYKDIPVENYESRNDAIVRTTSYIRVNLSNGRHFVMLYESETGYARMMLSNYKLSAENVKWFETLCGK